VTVTARRIVAVTAAAAAVVVLIWYIALLRPEMHKLSSAHAAYNSDMGQVATLQQQIASLEAIVRQAPHDNAELAVLDQAVPKNADLVDVLTQIHNLASSSGVQVLSLNPTKPVSSTNSTTAQSGQLQNVPLTMSGSGSYQQVRTFLTALAQMPRTVVVNTINLSLSQGSGSELSLSLNAVIYFAS
jgi:Tfp pilus assembly protein PilO